MKHENLQGFTEQVIGETRYVCLREDDPALMAQLEAAGFTQDPDVLDTWFSSALWPLSTLGWPENTPELDVWNPTAVLCTAREIITLWVSRMVMFNLYFTRSPRRDGVGSEPSPARLPFKNVFIHAMIQDGHGQKMSKSLGNGVDPMDIIHSHGADAMRFTLTSMTTHTQDVRLPVDCVDPHTGESFTPDYITAGGYKVMAPIQERHGKKMVTGYGLASGNAAPTDDMPLARNTSDKFDLGQRLCNKLWNAFRFALPMLDEAAGGASRAVSARPAADNLQLPDRWILARLADTIHACNTALSEYRFADYANAVYDFFWRDLCDWYLEAIKPRVGGGSQNEANAGESNAGAARAVLAACLDATLRLMHPAMPLITERLWASLPAGDRSVPGLELPPSAKLIHARWPAAPNLSDPEASSSFEMMQRVVGALREARSTHKVPPRQRVTVSARVDAPTQALLEDQRLVLSSLAQADLAQLGPDTDRPGDAALVVLDTHELYVHGIVDADAEVKRLAKRREDLERQIAALKGRLGNERYVANAPAKLVQESRDQLDAAERELALVAGQEP